MVPTKASALRSVQRAMMPRRGSLFPVRGLRRRLQCLGYARSLRCCVASRCRTRALAMWRQRRDERFRELAHLPPPKLGHFADFLCGFRIASRNRLHAVPRAQHAWIEREPLGCLVARRLERADARVELGIAIPARRARDLWQFRLRHRERALHRLEKLAAPLFEDAARHSLDPAERVARGRLRARDVEELFVAEHAERRTVELAGDGVAPGNQLAQHRQLAPAEIARAFEFEERHARIFVGPPRSLEQAEFLARPWNASHTLQLGRHLVLE